MRLTLVACLWIVVIGGVWLYMENRTGVSASAMHVEAVRLTGETFTLEVTTTFDAEPDPFALQTGDAAGAGIVVRRGGEDVLRSESLRSGEPVRVELTGLVAGVNEFVFEASPPPDAYGKAAGLRLRLLRGLSVVADRTFWAEGGAVVAGTFRPELAERPGVTGNKETGHE